MSATALVDSNVIIASIVDWHEHHQDSFDLLDSSERRSLAVAAHSYAEAFSTLTQQGPRGLFAFSPSEAWDALKSLSGVTRLIGLTSAQTLDAVREFAVRGGVGARLYDKLIGQAAVVNRIGAIVTWNAAHMRPLFPTLRVVTPSALLASLSRAR